MGRKNRLFALLIAVVMVVTSGVGVFAADSSTQGATSVPIATEVHTGSGTVDVPAGATVTVNGAPASVSGTSVSGVPKGALVVVTTADGQTDYRWMMTTKIKKAAKKKVTWKKAKGASYYLVKVVRKGKTYYKAVKGTKVTAKKLGLKSLKGAKVRVRPLKIVGGIVYAGGLSKTKKAK